MTCWYCRWGWPEPVADIYLRAEKDIDDLLSRAGTDWNGEPTCGKSALQYGPAHCTWADENFSGDHSEELYLCDEGKDCRGWLPGAVTIVRRSLIELAALPEDVRMPRPDYFTSNDENLNASDFPPPAGVEMVSI